MCQLAWGRSMKNKSRSYSLLLCILALGFVSGAFADEGDYAFLEPTVHYGTLTVVPWVKVQKAGAYRYVLESRVDSDSVSTTTTASGKIELPARLVRLHQTASYRLSGPNEKYKFTLKLLKGAQLIAQDTLSLPE